MNEQQENLIAEGISLLIGSSTNLVDEYKVDWINKYDDLFGEKKVKPMPYQEDLDMDFEVKFCEVCDSITSHIPKGCLQCLYKKNYGKEFVSAEKNTDTQSSGGTN